MPGVFIRVRPPQPGERGSYGPPGVALCFFLRSRPAGMGKCGMGLAAGRWMLRSLKIPFLAPEARGCCSLASFPPWEGERWGLGAAPGSCLLQQRSEGFRGYQGIRNFAQHNFWDILCPDTNPCPHGRWAQSSPRMFDRDIKNQKPGFNCSAGKRRLQLRHARERLCSSGALHR